MPVKAIPPIVVELTLERETKGTFVFSADDETAVVPTLYVKKAAFGKAPERVVLTIATPPA